MDLLWPREYGESDAAPVLIIAFKWPGSFYFCVIESLQQSKMSIIIWILLFRKQRFRENFSTISLFFHILPIITTKTNERLE